ncbi:hypothetical protein B0H11DRAFT_2223783 [Mycena galericulata]|nr:hypothetical protein B0H11DRAFT_2223783 [Mycena galericulata]
MKAPDIPPEDTVKLLADFLDLDTPGPYEEGGRHRNAEHFAHVYTYVRSPYRDLFVSCRCLCMLALSLERGRWERENEGVATAAAIATARPPPPAASNVGGYPSHPLRPSWLIPVSCVRLPEAPRVRVN